MNCNGSNFASDTVKIEMVIMEKLRNKITKLSSKLKREKLF